MYVCLYIPLQQQEHFYDVLPGMDLSPTNPVTLKPQTTRSSLQVCNILFFYLVLSRDGSSLSQMFFKIGVLKRFRNIHRKTSVLKSLFNKTADLRSAISLKRDSNRGVFLLILRIF